MRAGNRQGKPICLTSVSRFRPWQESQGPGCGLGSEWGCPGLWGLEKRGKGALVSGEGVGISGRGPTMVKCQVHENRGQGGAWRGCVLSWTWEMGH